jgi:hypothetical protein
MQIGQRDVKIFKIKNRRGYAAICEDCLTEGNTTEEAYARMVKAINRIARQSRLLRTPPEAERRVRPMAEKKFKPQSR